jgi:hypothetical protein
MLGDVGRCLSVFIVLIASVLMAGCTAGGLSTTSLTSPRSATITFESIDGLPESQFQKLVRSLSEEAETRQLAVVGREANAQFRARGYAAAHLRGKRTVVTWVWDVYDTDQQRALRISGEEPAGGSQRGWAAADDQTLRRIARQSLDQLAGFLMNPGSEPSVAPPGRTAPGIAVAATEDEIAPKGAGTGGYAALAHATAR